MTGYRHESRDDVVTLLHDIPEEDPEKILSGNAARGYGL